MQRSIWFVICVVTALSMKAAVWAETFGATLKPDRPEGAVVVPSEKGAISAAISAGGTGTTFFLKAGVHVGNGELRPQAGSVFVGEAGAILDGGNETARCFTHDVGVIPYSSSAPRYIVTLRNLVIRNFAPADQECAVMAQDTGQGWQQVLSKPADRNGWLLDHCTFAANRAGGAFLGSGSTAQDCLAVDNGQVGFKATGLKVQLLNCRAARNNSERKFNYFVEAGGVKCWNVKDLLVDGGECDHNGGLGFWLDYTWDGNVIRNANFHDNLRAGVSIEMTVGAEVTACQFSNDDRDGIAGDIPASFRPWENSPRSGPDLRMGEIFLFNGCASGDFVEIASNTSYSFTGRTWIHANQIRNGGGGVMALYQDRAGINPLSQLQGNSNGPIAGLAGTVVEDNEIECDEGYAAGVNTLVNRDYKDAAGSWGPIPAKVLKQQFQSIVYRKNRYSAATVFCIPKAAAQEKSDSVWDWNGRADVDLAKWRSLMRDTAPPDRK
jgi:hypothetical protein